MLAEQDLDLPAGCSIVIDTQAIDLLAQLVRPSRSEDRLRELIEAWIESHDGQRPTALEMSIATRRAHDVKTAGGWFGVLDQLGLLTPSESVVLSQAADLLVDIEHGAYTKSYKLITWKVLVGADRLRDGMTLREVAQGARWLIERDPRLSADLADAAASFGDVTNPTADEWVAYWRMNPIHALTGRGRRSDQGWLRDDDDRLALAMTIPNELGPTLDAMVTELVDYRLHRYLVGRAARRTGEERKVADATGQVLDATFVVEGQDGRPTSLLWHSSGGASASGKARNVDYVTGLDLLLERFRRLAFTVEDAYIDTASTVDLPVTDRRLSPGDMKSFPVDMAAIEDIASLRTSILRSMAKAGRAPGATGSGNMRKAMRLVLSNAGDFTSAELADALASGRWTRKPGRVSSHADHGATA